MSKILDKVKDWFTDVIGAILMIMGVILSWDKQIDFIWTGIAMLVAGFILVVIPDKEIAAAIKAWAKKKFGSHE